MIDLNKVVDATDEKKKNGHGQEQQGPISDAALRHVETAAQEVAKTANQFGNRLAFRGLLKDVRGLKNGALLAKAGMDWETLALPVLRGALPIEKATEIETGGEAYKTHQSLYKAGMIPKVFALTRSDTGGHLAITSDKFMTHQNPEIIKGLHELAEVGGAEILFAGCVDDGRKVVAIACLEGEFTLPDKSQQNKATNDHSGNVREGTGDKTHCFIVLSGGHEQGTPFRIRGMAWRLWCMNGVYFLAKAKTSYSRSHQGKLGKNEEEAIKATYAGIREEFAKYGEEAQKLQETEAEKDQQRLFVAELIAPGITTEIEKELGPKGRTYNFTRNEIWKKMQENAGKKVLNEAIKAHEKEAGFALLGKQLLRSIEEQDGANGSNLWTAYNGITWHVDHMRGRTNESGVDAALFGAGARLKERALVTAQGFVNH